MALLVNQSQQVTGFPRQKVQDVLVVTEVDLVPHHALFQVLLLLQLEDVRHEELLELLVCEINAQLLKTGKRQNDVLLKVLRSIAAELCDTRA